MATSCILSVAKGFENTFITKNLNGEYKPILTNGCKWIWLIFLVQRETLFIYDWEQLKK